MAVEAIIYAHLFLWMNRPKTWKIDRNVVEVNKCIWKNDEEKTVVTLRFSDGKTVEFKLGRHVAPMTSASFATLVSELAMFQYDSLFWFQNRMKANTCKKYLVRDEND